ncbi:MAG: helix-turn-helix domain-containing protein [Acidimicrobiales bacterium]
MSFDVALADDRAVPLPSNVVLGHETVAWMSLSFRLPVRVLDVLIGYVDPAVFANGGIGAPIVSPLDERSQISEAIKDRMEVLEEAAWAPAGAEAIDIGGTMRARGLTPSRVAQQIEVDAGEVTALVRGDRMPTPEQATKLAPILGVAAEALTAPHAVDPDLMWVLDRPRFRRRLAERGRSNGVTDEIAWRYYVATSELPTAARFTQSSGARSRWTALVEDYLNGR